MCTKNGSYCEKEKNQGGCELRSEVSVKIQKKNCWGGGGGSGGGSDQGVESGRSKVWVGG